VSVNFYLSMWTISSPQLLGDVCSSKSLLVEIEKEKMHAHHTGTPAHTHMPCTAHTPCTHPCTGTHCTHAIHRHTRHAHIHAQAHTAHTPYTGTHAHARHCTRTRTALTHQCTARTHTGKKLRVKEGNPFKLSFYEAGVAISVRHISSAPKESPTPQWSCKLVEQQLQSWFGGVGALPNTPLLLTCAMLCSFSHTTPGLNQ
jgi:hypothetical protein